ncbi:hypothetical protein B0H13DRAFT_1885754 [Mycena leptocephala]|nr:hypothetical protein B0H13DRAFT_1885754 [Mycena leptocephala]
MDTSLSTPNDEVLDLCRLPPELERIIFEIAALLEPANIPTLMRIAWRVKHWVEPLLYRVIFLSSNLSIDNMHGFPVAPLDIWLEVISKKSASFVESSVSHIFLETDSEEGREQSILDVILAPRIKNLFCYDVSAPQYLPVLDGLQCLSHLTIDLRSLFAPGGIDFTAPLFRNLTHLELLDDCDGLPSDIGAGLALIPNLTHVAFNPTGGVGALHASVRTNMQLLCIVFFTFAETYPDSDDARVVCIRQTNFRADWIRGAATGEDYWALADAFIAAKHAEKVDRSLYCISDTDESWRV